MTRSIPLLALSVFILTLAFALSPMFARGFAGFQPAQFPVAQQHWPIQPAGWAFGIWGVIYAWLIAGSAWGLRHAQSDPEWTAMRRPLVISLALGTFWIAVANVSPVGATVMIAVMAATAIRAMLRAGTGSPFLQVRPVALYSGWLTAATGVAVGVVLGGYGILSDQAAALAMLAAVLVVALAVQARLPGEWAYPLAIIWALVGIIAANIPAANWPVIGMAALGVAVLALQFLLRGLPGAAVGQVSRQ